MTISALWDRFFWSFVLLVFAAIVWLWYFDESQRYFPFGFLVGFAVGGAYFVKGLRDMRATARRIQKAVAEAEQAAAMARMDEEPRDA